MTKPLSGAVRSPFQRVTGGTSTGGSVGVPIIDCDVVFVLSASILNYSIANETARIEVRAFMQQLGVPDASMPVIDTTYSVAGWTAENYISSLPALIDAAAAYTNPMVLIHGFGNNVTRDGPWPGGGVLYEQQMREVVNTLIGAGIRVLNSSLSYRIPPGSAPSAPYNLHLNEPIIRELTPWCWDAAENRPVYDLYDFTRKADPRFYDADNVHPSLAGRQRIRGYTAEVLARLILGRRQASPGEDYYGKRFVWSFGDEMTAFNNINPVITNEIGGSAATDGRGAAWSYSCLAADGSRVFGPHVEAAFHSNTNTVGRATEDRSSTLYNGVLLGSSIFTNVADSDAGYQAYIEVSGLPDGLTGRLRLTASRSAGTPRTGTYRVVSGAPTDRGDKTLDANLDPPGILEWPITVNEGRVRIEYNASTAEIYAYVNGIELEFDPDPRAPLESTYTSFNTAAILGDADGVAFDLADTSLMFRDAEGTQPVEKYGDQVVRINNPNDGTYLLSDRPAAATVEAVNGKPFIRLRNSRYLLKGLDPAFTRPVISTGTYDADDTTDVLYWYNNNGPGYGARKWGVITRPGQYRMFHNTGSISVAAVDVWGPFHAVYLDRVNNQVTVDGAITTLSTLDETYSATDSGFALGGYPGNDNEAFYGILTHFIIANAPLNEAALNEMNEIHRTMMGV